MAPQNSAAWLSTKCLKPLELKSAPYKAPGPNQIVVKNHAVAINPVDWAKQLLGNLLLGYIKYPFILGGDVAGEVVEVGSGVQRFRVGDRVLGHAMAMAPESNDPAEGAFQNYTIIREHLAAPVPEWTSYEEACVLPLTFSTAAYGLFNQDYLGLRIPTVPAPATTSSSEALIVTGGATSVGSNAIQLAVSAGYQVYSTSSPKNFDYVKKLGATQVFDYHSPTLVDDMVSELQGKTLVGAYAIGDGAVEVSMKVLRRCKAKKKFVADAGFVIPAEQLQSYLGTASAIGGVMVKSGKMALKSFTTGVSSKFVVGKDLCLPTDVVGQMYTEFLPRALEANQFVAAPKPLIVGKGLEHIQEALDVQAKGVSATKVVVSL